MEEIDTDECLRLLSKIEQLEAIADKKGSLSPTKRVLFQQMRHDLQKLLAMGRRKRR
jgi:hypothetical protein